MTYQQALDALENEPPPPPAWHIVWGTYKGGRVGIEFEIFAAKGGQFFARPVGIVVGPNNTRIRFKEECPPDFVDLSLGFEEGDIETLLEIAGFTAHQRLRIAHLAVKREE